VGKFGGMQADGASGGEQQSATPIGVARLSKMMFDGEDLTPLWRELVGKYIYQRNDAAALMDLATVEQLFGNLEDGLARQAEALELCRIYRSPVPDAMPRLRLLAFAAPGDIGVNTPLEFLLEGSDVALSTLYVVPGLPLPEKIPEHDLAFVAVGESDANLPILAEIERLAESWPRPVLNRPDHIRRLARERLFAVLDGAPGVVMPMTLRVDRMSLERVAAGVAALADLLPEGAFPVILRPVGSHAGRGLMKLDGAEALAAYLAAQQETEFYLSRFIDYAGPDALFRKYRIVFIEGSPYACHMAIADQWMIYYLNAGRKASAAKRAEEERFMVEFDTDFARRHAAALGAIASRVGLDYFGIDCAETADGKLLLFEADIAMIVHAMDSPAIFPYKPPQMQKVFDAFRAMLRRKGGREPARTA
jgi:glutathione synthase/RimK-type ligase-like ATP-grasp enzyme